MPVLQSISHREEEDEDEEVEVPIEFPEEKYVILQS